MGAWGHESFENDDAMDWMSELDGTEGTEPIAEAFEAVLEADDYLEAPDASMGLAAAEVVAALLGKPAAKLPDEVTAWVKGKKPPKPGLVKKAQKVVKRVLKASELKELWAGSENEAPWTASVEDLLKRLSEGSGSANAS